MAEYVNTTLRKLRPRFGDIARALIISAQIALSVGCVVFLWSQWQSMYHDAAILCGWPDDLPFSIFNLWGAGLCVFFLLAIRIFDV